VDLGRFTGDKGQFEDGSMVNPATGMNTAYIEEWDDEEIEAVEGELAGGERVCVVLEWVHPESKTSENGRPCPNANLGSRLEGGDGGRLLRLGKHIQGIIVHDAVVSLERWKWFSPSELKQTPSAGSKAASASHPTVYNFCGGEWRCEISMGPSALPIMACFDRLRNVGEKVEGHYELPKDEVPLKQTWTVVEKEVW
jgi:Protein HRI1